jgi:hypothetical protein
VARRVAGPTPTHKMFWYIRYILFKWLLNASSSRLRLPLSVEEAEPVAPLDEIDVAHVHLGKPMCGLRMLTFRSLKSGRMTLFAGPVAVVVTSATRKVPARTVALTLATSYRARRHRAGFSKPTANT